MHQFLSRQRERSELLPSFYHFPWWLIWAYLPALCPLHCQVSLDFSRGWSAKLIHWNYELDTYGLHYPHRWSCAASGTCHEGVPRVLSPPSSCEDYLILRNLRRTAWIDKQSTIATNSRNIFSYNSNTVHVPLGSPYPWEFTKAPVLTMSFCAWSCEKNAHCEGAVRLTRDENCSPCDHCDMGSLGGSFQNRMHDQAVYYSNSGQAKIALIHYLFSNKKAMPMLSVLSIFWILLSFPRLFPDRVSILMTEETLAIHEACSKKMPMTMMPQTALSKFLRSEKGWGLFGECRENVTKIALLFFNPNMWQLDECLQAAIALRLNGKSDNF